MLTFIAALRHDRIDAPCVIDEPINGQGFLAWIEQFLLRTLAPGDVVIIANLRVTKARQSTAIRGVDARLLFVSPYSTDLNPIEQVSRNSKPRSAKLMSAQPERSGAAPGFCAAPSPLPSARTKS